MDRFGGSFISYTGGWIGVSIRSIYSILCWHGNNFNLG